MFGTQIPQEDPLDGIKSWFQDASQQSEWFDAFILATTDGQGVVSCRTVGVTLAADGRFVFCTSTMSRKAAQIGENPRVAIVAFWHSLQRQLRVEGEARLDSESVADEHFASLPRDAQIMSWVTRNGEPQTPREFDEDASRIALRFSDRQIPRPSAWRAFCVSATRIEFWEAIERWHHRCRRFDFDREHNMWRGRYVGP
jgi:pyridoxamine 5'-phosphate oxidase